MPNMEIVKMLEKTNDEVDFVKITHNDGSITTMMKSIYDEMQAEQSTPNLPA
jgi:hypothetical protein